MSLYYLLDVSAVPAPEADLTVLVSDLGVAIQTSTKAAKDTELIHLYQVLGENSLVAVIKGDVDSVRKALNTAAGGDVHLCCTPMRAYEDFARTALKVDSSLTRGGRKVAQDGLIFMAESTVNYDGETSENLLSVWKAEAEVALAPRKDKPEDASMDLYKAMWQRRGFVFMSTKDVDASDDFIWSLPLVTKLKGGMLNFARMKQLKVFQVEQEEEEGEDDGY